MGGIDSLPTEYGYVVCVLVLYFFVNFYMSIQVGAARKKYKVFYPTLYALESENKDAKLFNCVQRGHQNALENMPIFFLFLSLGGIKHPIIASSFGLLYCVSRFFYFQRYSTGQPENRVAFSALGFLATFALVGCSISLAVHLLI